MLGGKVIHGDKIGRKLGFPTANIDIDKKLLKEMRNGVYACWVFLGKKKYGGAMAFRISPFKLEIHVLDFDGDLYGKHLEFDLVQKVSEMEKYDEVELVDKIKSDIEKVKNLLGVK